MGGKVDVTAMSKGLQGAVLRMLHADEFRLRVVSTALECGGLMKRVTFSSCGRLPDALFEPAAWMRLWFRTETGREVQRAYTVAGFAPDHSTIDVSFYLHQTSGPAASWAQWVQSGATLDVSVLGSWPFHMNEHDDGVVLLGDETAFPALRAILSGLPDGVRAHVLLTGEHDLTEFIPSRPGLDVRCMPARRAARGFERMLRGLDDERRSATGNQGKTETRPGMTWDCWAAGESSRMRAVRAAVKHSDAVRSQESHIQGYWSLHHVI